MVSVFYCIDDILLNSVSYQFIEQSYARGSSDLTAGGWLVNIDTTQGSELPTEDKHTPNLPPLNNYRL